jgi:hypothetical protein
MQDARIQVDRTGRTFQLEAGALTLTAPATARKDLFRIAERINPKRAFLFVSTVLGRHIPVHPAEHRAALQELADGVSSHLLAGPVFVMGFAETAVGIGAGVFDCLRMVQGDRAMGYLTTTRFSPSRADTWFMIEESHSHAVDHIILHPGADVVQHGPDATLVLVDDETTTGKTFAQLAMGLHAQGLTFGRVVLVTLTDWSDGRAAQSVQGLFGQAEICCVSLQQGSWVWAPKKDWVHPGLPADCAVHCPPWIPDRAQRFAAPRTGISSSKPRQSGEHILTMIEADGFTPVAENDRVLVVGAGEHVWQPMLAAEALSARGHDTRFITTTRSPILQGDTIRHKFSFPDHYGQGFWMYVHNIVSSDWDRIVLFTETGADGVPADLVNWLGRVDIIDGNGTVTAFPAERFVS